MTRWLDGEAVAAVEQPGYTPLVVTIDEGLVSLWQDTDLVFISDIDATIKALREAKKRMNK